MGFRQDAFARVWSVNHNEKYSTGNITVSRKRKDSNEYEVVFGDGFVRFIGDAHKKISGVSIPEKVGVSIKILSCDVENRYDANTKKMYTNYIIYDFEFPDGNGASKGGSGNGRTNARQSAPSNDYVEVSEDELPF